MKVVTPKSTVIRGGNASRERGFTMKATAQSFQIMSGGIYSNQIAAVHRELGCNGADANTRAGNKNTPIRVHIPNKLEPFAAYEDDGVGLSDIQVRGEYICPNCGNTEDSDFEADKMIEFGSAPCKCGCKLSDANFEAGIYITYFDSDKMDDEKLTGCKGLGSKTPLAYTDQFTLTTVKDGIRNVYSSFLNEQGMPAIKRLHTESTTDGNGVKVEVAVKEDDIPKFIEEAVKTYQWFDPKPEFSGIEDFEFPEQKFLLETDDYGITQNDDSYTSPSSVVMGNVRYSVSYNDFNFNIRRKFSAVEEIFLKHGIMMKVDLTEAADTAASREKLRMTEHTIGIIKRKLAIAEADCLTEVQRQIDACPTRFAARLKYKELMEKTVLGRIAKKSDVDPMWNGKECKPFVSFTRTDNVEQFPKDENGNQVEGPPKISKVETTMANAIVCKLKTNRNYSLKFTREHSCYGVSVDENVVLFVQDKSHGSYAAVERYLREGNGNKVAYLLQDKGRLTEFLADTELTAKNVSELPKPERQPKGAGTAKKTAKAVVFCGTRYREMPSECWEDYTIDDLDAGGVYVEVHRYSWKAEGFNCGEFDEPRYLRDHAEYASKLDPDLENVIGLRKALAEKVKDNPNWIRLDVHIANCIVAQSSLVNKAAQFGVWQNISSVSKNIIGKMEDTEIDTNGTLGSLINESLVFKDCGTKEVCAFKRASQKYSFILGDKLPKATDYSNVMQSLTKRWSEFESEYPMLYFVDFDYSLNGDKLDKVVDYINDIDDYTPPAKPATAAA